MKKIFVYGLSAVLTLVIFAAGYALFMTGEGAASTIKFAFLSCLNSDNISREDYIVPSGKSMRYTSADGTREVDEELLNHIYIDGIRYDFPLHINDLGENFSLSPWSIDSWTDTDSNITTYDFYSKLYYNEIFCGNISFSSDTDTLPDDIVIDLFLTTWAAKGENAPEILIAGFDVTDTDPYELMASLGITSGDYYYGCINAPCDGGKSYNCISIYENKITSLKHRDKPYTSPFEYACYKEETLTLPDDYKPENKLSYTELPEYNDEMELACQSITVNGCRLTLPCTVGELIYALCGNSDYPVKLNDSFNLFDSEDISDDVGYNCFKGRIGYTGSEYYPDVEFMALLEKDKSLLDSQVIYIYAGNDFELENYVVDDNGNATLGGYPLISDIEEGTYHLTDYRRNNLCISMPKGNGYFVSLYYFPDDLGKREPPSSDDMT